MIDLPQDPQTALSALASYGRLGTYPEMRGMRDHLKGELARLDSLNRREIDSVTNHQRQGACQVLEKILELAETADAKAEQIRANHQRKGVKL